MCCSGSDLGLFSELCMKDANPITGFENSIMCGKENQNKELIEPVMHAVLYIYPGTLIADYQKKKEILFLQLLIC